MKLHLTLVISNLHITYGAGKEKGENNEILTIGNFKY